MEEELGAFHRRYTPHEARAAVPPPASPVGGVIGEQGTAIRREGRQRLVFWRKRRVHVPTFMRAFIFLTSYLAVSGAFDAIVGPCQEKPQMNEPAVRAARAQVGASIRGEILLVAPLLED